MLRGKYPDKASEITMPILGVNLRDPQQLLADGECVKLSHCYYDGAVKSIPGTRAITPSALHASTRLTGGHRFYKRDGTKKRLVAYGTTISDIDDAGIETRLTATATATATMLFSTWPISDRAYGANGSDNPYYYDG